MSDRPNQHPQNPDPLPTGSGGKPLRAEQDAGPDALDHVFQSYVPEEETYRPRVEPVSPNEFERPSRRESQARVSLTESTQHWHDKHDRHIAKLQRRFRWIRNGLGLIAGLILLQLAAWWLPNKQGVDPLGLAKTLPARFSSWAPEYLRSSIALTSNESNGAGAADGSVDDGEQGVGPEKDAQEDAAQPVTSLKPDSAVLAGESGRSIKSSKSTDPGVEPMESSAPTEPTEATEPSEAAADENENDGDNGGLEPADIAPRISDDESDDWHSQIRQATKVEQTLDRLMDTMRELDDMRLEQRRVAAMELFEGLCDVGSEMRIPDQSDLKETAAGANRFAESQRGVQAAARSVLGAIATAPEKVAFISRYSSRRLDELSLDDPGIILAGKIRTVMEYQPGIWALGMVSPFEPNRPVTIHLSDRRLSTAISTGDSILALGHRIPVEAGDSQSVHISANVVYLIEDRE